MSGCDLKRAQQVVHPKLYTVELQWLEHLWDHEN